MRPQGVLLPAIAVPMPRSCSLQPHTTGRSEFRVSGLMSNHLAIIATKEPIFFGCDILETMRGKNVNINLETNRKDQSRCGHNQGPRTGSGISP